MPVDQNSLPYSASFSAALKQTFDRAEKIATTSGSGTVSEANLLAALCDDPDAITVLLSNRIDIGKLKSAIRTSESGRVGVQDTSQVKYSADVKRLLILAIRTSMEIKLPEVDGAVFIAVMIGDQNNYSANLLSQQGLTFEAVVSNLKTRLNNIQNSNSPGSKSFNNSSARTSSYSPGGRDSGPGSQSRAPGPDSIQDPNVSGRPAPVSPGDLGLTGSETEIGPRKKYADSYISDNPDSKPENESQVDASFEDALISEEEAFDAPTDSEKLPRIVRQNDQDQHQPDIRADLDQMENEKPDQTAPPKQRYSSPKSGKLFENIPRSMKSMISRQVEVRISEQDSQNIFKDIPGTVEQHNILITEAMSIQLKAPDGGFSIESQTPETQWTNNLLGLPNSSAYGLWRWLVTPTIRGRHRLQLIVSARTVNKDGLAAEKLLPEQIIDVRVRINYGRQIKKLAVWTIAATCGGLLGKYGETAVQWLISQT